MRMLASAIAVAAALATSASASITVYTSRSAFDSLGAITAIDWSVYGPAGTTISTPDFRTVPPVTIGITSSQGALMRHDEGTDYTGDFAPGAHLLSDAGSESDSFSVFFSSPVQGLGTQIESHYITGAWTGSIDIFDSAHTMIASVPISGTKGAAEDNSAPFYGILSSSADIGAVSFFVDQTLPPPDERSGAVAINRLDVLAFVPEASSLSFLAGGLLMFGGLFLLRRRALTS